MIKRQGNWLGQMRVDVPHLRALESSIANDFDALAGQILGGSGSFIVSGFNIVFADAIGAAASSLRVNVSNGAIWHANATESGTFFVVDEGTATYETLSTTNTRVSGGFVANATNYLGVDFVRSIDDTTADVVKFLSANTGTETARTVPLARTLDYKFIITTTPFVYDTTICPIAKIDVDSSGNVTSVVDARNMLFRLGLGGDSVNTTYSYPWDTGRTEQTDGASYDTFVGGDKDIRSLKDWMNAVMTSIKEIKGSTYWYGGDTGIFAHLGRTIADAGSVSLSTTPTTVALNSSEGAVGLTVDTGTYTINNLRSAGVWKMDFQFSATVTAAASSPTAILARAYVGSPVSAGVGGYTKVMRYDGGAFTNGDTVTFSGSIVFQTATDNTSGVKLQLYTDAGTMSLDYAGATMTLQRVGGSY